MSLRNDIKGWLGEKVTQAAMWMMLDSKVYQRFDNILVQTEAGSTQIDHVILSKYGLFVVETKNYEGWIFGGATQREWTQSLFGKKNRFQNPLHQNYKHTKALAEYLKIEHDKIHSIISFIGDATFKTAMPSNVISGGLIPYIKDFTSEVFRDDDIARLEALLISLKSGAVVTSKEHVAQLRERYESASICPKCGKALLQRTAKTGMNAGKAFLGCSGFPECRYIKSR